MPGLFLLTLLFLPPGVLGFTVESGPSWNHQKITDKAILNVTAQACRSVAQAEGRDFTFPTSLTTESVLAACSAPEAAKDFESNMFYLRTINLLTDLAFLLSPSRHFDDETFNEGKTLITEGLDAVKANVKKGNFFAARVGLAVILHTLQDFYSHSNWIEMGNNRPNSNLISKQDSIGNIADKNRRTCRNCIGTDCTNNILEDILNEKVLTSGYFALWPLNGKPIGKCSHGDDKDNTRHSDATGGINKDTLTSVHGHLHIKAAEVAVSATSELLNDVRGAAGDKEFLRMMGVNPGKALCFVIDTTGSMGDDIVAVRTVTSEIINKRLGTKNEPSLYILVPFNDPDFGPLMRTTDSKAFKDAINALYPHDGGDAPEMSLSGLQLALTGAPYGSEIFLFTDAGAKDAYLKSTVTALIERTRSVVSFMITSFASLRRRRSNTNQQQSTTRLAAVESQVYKDLAVVSGGQAIEVAKGRLLEATSIVLETSSSTLVTLLQAVRDPGKSENFTFSVDDTVKNLTIYITGTSTDFTLISPSGTVQENTNGSLTTSSALVGNLRALNLKTETGQWEIRMRSTNPYNIKIVAQTPIDFFFSFMKPSQGPYNSYTIVDNRPKAGVNGTLMITLLGSDTATVTEVYLVESSGSGQVKGTIISQDNKEYLVHFDVIPSQEFNVVVKGQNGNSSTKSTPASFLRQSTTSIKASFVSVTASQTNTIVKPGADTSVSFTVSTNGTGGTFTIRATNDKGFNVSFPSTLEVGSGSSVNGTVQITVPNDTESGTVVTLTIEAQSPGGDVNYVVSTITVLTEVTDVTRPVCELLSLQSNCSDNCSISWQLSVRLSDGVNGTGLNSVYIRQGSGTLNTSLTSENDTMASYEASCCSPTVEIIAVDGVGNVGSCSFSVNVSSSTITTPQPTSAATTTTTSVAPRFVQSTFLCFTISLLIILFTS